jgi:hypothetical protein
MAHDLVASFYGGYDQVGLARPVRLRIPRMAAILAIAGILLVAFIAADVSAYQNLAVTVKVTSVEWFVEGEALTTSGGFSLHGSQSTTLSLTCSTVCYRFVGATASSPFTVLGFSVSYHPIQYTNVTVQAPTSAYDGPLSVTLEVPSAGTAGPAD